MKHIIQIPVGDWSDDGHGKCEWFSYFSNKAIGEWREAYFLARERWPHLAPDEALGRVPSKEWPLEEIRSFLKFSTDGLEDNEPEAFAQYVLTFCQKADPSLKYEEMEVGVLTYPGRDEKGRHIGHIGYEIWMDDF